MCRQALALFDRMLAAKVRPDLFSFNAAISAAGLHPVLLAR